MLFFVLMFSGLSWNTTDDTLSSVRLMSCSAGVYVPDSTFFPLIFLRLLIGLF